MTKNDGTAIQPQPQSVDFLKVKFWCSIFCRMFHESVYFIVKTALDIYTERNHITAEKNYAQLPSSPKAERLNFFIAIYWIFGQEGSLA